MCDLHMHAPQYAFRGLGMNLENPDWDMGLKSMRFPMRNGMRTANTRRWRMSG